MKTRWMKTVIDASKIKEPALPYSRTIRVSRLPASLVTDVQTLKTA